MYVAAKSIRHSTPTRASSNSDVRIACMNHDAVKQCVSDAGHALDMMGHLLRGIPEEAPP